ncbi:hypothetical protein RHMOL_Rhmol02G0252200 [Rhododendron molle]|uniref:Uncharacterized protein n=1 Tax=Rhododendron molle TaxID=49168 RepID=A0ACC0PVL3_RHOML|nr:hypothetical protein RHMOL_Rhmol02G0252200 [Rhododendron molle]
MELEVLGLPLIPTGHSNPLEGFDRNRNGFEPNDQKECCMGRKFDHENDYYKRSFEAACNFEEVAAGESNRNAKSSLLCWHGQPNEEDDDGKEERKGASFTTDMNEEDQEAENHVVGWPPIKSWRKKLMQRQQGGGRMMEDRTVERGSRGSNSTYVEVRMAGVPTGTKNDLQLFHSSRALSDTLITMFGSCSC